METEASRALVNRAFAVFATRDAAEIAGLFTPDAEWIAPPDNATAVALGGDSCMKGAEAIARFLATETRRLFLEMALDLGGFYADGAHVVVEGRLTAKLLDGRRYVNDYCFVFVCHEGRIALVREYMDTLAGHRQIFEQIARRDGASAASSRGG
jgi:uncharacterized protein